MVIQNTKLLQNLQVFSNGCLLFTTNAVKHVLKSKVLLSEKDLKSLEMSFQTKLSKVNNKQNIFLNYRKKLFK